MRRALFFLLLLVATTVSARPDLLDQLGLGGDSDIPPTVDEAFSYSVELKDSQTLRAGWQVAEGNYLYRDKIRFELPEQSSVSLKNYVLPVGKNKMDEVFGLSEVYSYDTFIELPLNRNNEASEVTLVAHYQGCSETFNICYPPTSKTVTLELPAIDASSSQNQTAPQSTPVVPLSDQDRLAQSLAQDNLFKVLLSFFGLGILLAFTPCVFPMIPILSSIIVGEGEHVTTRRAFILSLTYVLAMSITYTVAGVLTGLLGENLQAMFQNPWIIGSFSALFVILALSMFGLYELQLPHFLQNRLHQASHRQQGGTLWSVGIMGLLSGLIVGPCLAPPLAGALIFIGQNGDPFLGGSALFALSMGMGLPLIAIGTSEGSLLPKAGDWMTTIKSVFGVLMLGLAIWMLERVIPAWLVLILWGALAVVVAIYLGAFNTLAVDSDGWAKFWKGIGLTLFIYGVLLIVGGASGSHNLWQPLKTVTAQVSSSSQAASNHVNFTQVNNITELEQLLKSSDHPVMFDFYADWCVDCKKMEQTTFIDSGVISSLANWQTVQIDVTENNAQHQQLMQQLNVFGPPTILFFNAQGQEVRQARLVGYIDASSMQQHLAQLKAL
jgi:thiol:disulfide interchange protein DsbD